MPKLNKSAILVLILFGLLLNYLVFTKQQPLQVDVDIDIGNKTTDVINFETHLKLNDSMILDQTQGPPNESSSANGVEIIVDEDNMDEDNMDEDNMDEDNMDEVIEKKEYEEFEIALNQVDQGYSLIENQKGKPEQKYPEKRIILAKYNEDTNWVDYFNNIEHLVYSHVQSVDVSVIVLPDKGREATLYLRHIIDYYDTIANVTVFIHAHRSAWHTKDSLKIIENLRWGQEGYSPFHGFLLWKESPNITEEYTVYNTLNDIWGEFFEPYVRYPMPKVIRHTCCSEFAVTREYIHKQPLNFYENLYDWGMKDPISSWEFGHLVEIAWHIIFGMNPYLMESDFDFCSKVIYCENVNQDLIDLHHNPITPG